MGKLRATRLSVASWCLATCGAMVLMVSTLGPESAIPGLAVAGCVLSALGGVLYGVCWLWAHRSGGDGS